MRSPWIGLLLLAASAGAQSRSVVRGPAALPSLTLPSAGTPELALAPIAPGPMNLEVLQVLSAPAAQAAALPVEAAAPARAEPVSESRPADAPRSAEEKERKAPVLGDLRAMAEEASEPQSGPQASGNYEAKRGGAGRWDGVKERVELRERIPVFAERRRVLRAVRFQHAERPALDYREQSFSPERAQEFAAETFEMGEGIVWTGRQLLEALMTPQGLIPTTPPDKARVDLGLFGKSDAILQTLAAENGIAPYRLHDALERAYREGLIFKFDSARLKKTFYGVPEPVRRALGLTAPEPSPAEAPRAAAPAKPTPLSESLAALAGAVEGLPAKDETFEFAAQAAAAMIEAGLVRQEDLPAGFVAKARSIGFETPPLGAAVMTLYESSRGTPYFTLARAFARRAADAGLLEPEDARSVN